MNVCSTNAPYKPPERVFGAQQPSAELPAAVTAAVAAASSHCITKGTSRRESNTLAVSPDLSKNISATGKSAAWQWQQGGVNSVSLLGSPDRSNSMHVQGRASDDGGTDEVTAHDKLLAKLSATLQSRDNYPDQHTVYIPPDGLDVNTSDVHSLAGPSERVNSDDQAANIQQALQMCETDKIQPSLGITGGVGPVSGTASGLATGATVATPHGAGGYVKLDQLMNGTGYGLGDLGLGGYPGSVGPQTTIEPPDNVSGHYDHQSDAGIDTAFNVLLECFAMMQWEV
jgi:hypothetical protein